MTPQEKQERKDKDRLLTLCNRLRSQHNFGNIKTKRDLLYAAGLDAKSIVPLHFSASELDAPVSYHDVVEYCTDLLVSYNTTVWLSKNPPDVSDLKGLYDKALSHDTVVALPTETTNTSTIQADLVEVEPAKEENYGFRSSPNESKDAFFYWFQKKAIVELYDSIVKHQKRGQLLLAGVGTGKTYIAGALFRRLIDIGFHDSKTFSPFPYIYVTRASIVEQTKRVFRNTFNLTEDDVTIINIEQLRTRFGAMFVKEETIIERGEEHIVWRWKKNVFPVFILWDECQALKNTDSQQSSIAQSYNEIDSPETYQVFMSATPFTRVVEAKCFCVATRIAHDYGVARGIPLTNKHWNDFAAQIASPADPIEHSPAAISRLIDRFDSYIVRVRGVKPQFHALNTVQMIDFQSEDDRAYYHEAWDRYIAEKAKIEADDSPGGRFQILVQFLKFRQAAELCRARYIAQAMWQSVQLGQAAVCSFNFKHSIKKTVKILIEDYNVSRSSISLIWGGGNTAVSKKKKVRLSLLNNRAALDMLLAEGVEMSDLDIDEDELQQDEQEAQAKDPDEYRFGIQSPVERQKEIDRFQSGKTLYCFYTHRAGGVGLSLHHTDELCAEKVRHKESGYAVEEDIPLIPTRQREGFHAPTYSAIELVQSLGRAPRLTSLSDTPQSLVFFRGTIEERVAYVVSVKLRCLTKVVRQREDWQDVVTSTDGGKGDTDEAVRRHVENTPSEKDVPDEDSSGDLVEDSDELED